MLQRTLARPVPTSTSGSPGSSSQPEARSLALAEVRQALEINEDQEDAQLALGDLKFRHDWDWKGGEAALSESHRAQWKLHVCANAVCAIPGRRSEIG